MKINILLAAFVSSAALLSGVESADPAPPPYPCADPMCQDEFLEGEQCTKGALCGDCNPEEICPRLCASCNKHDGSYTLAGLSCDCPPLPPDCKPPCMFPTNGLWTCNTQAGCGGCQYVPYPNAACDIMCAKCGGDTPKGGLVCDCPEEPPKCHKQCLFEKNGKWTCKSQEGCEDCKEENPDACEIMCNKCREDDPLGGLDCQCSSPPTVAPAPTRAPTFQPICNDDCLSESLDICSSAEGCRDCHLNNEKACEIMCDKCDYGALLGGLDCACPPPPPSPTPTTTPICNPICLKTTGKGKCKGQQGCQECDKVDANACDIMCEKCDEGDPLGALDCDCTPAPTNAPNRPNPDDKCFAACEAFPKGLWVCDSVEGCGGCDPATCDTLCEKCGGYGYQEFGGLGCDCGPAPAPTAAPGPAPTAAPGPAPTAAPGPAPTAAPGPGKCYAACEAYPKGLWVCDSIQGCDGCNDSICGNLCDKCGRPYGDNDIAGLNCHCD